MDTGDLYGDLFFFLDEFLLLGARIGKLKQTQENLDF